MRKDLVVPGEGEEKFMVATNTKVVTVQFTPLESRMAKEKPELMPGLQKLHELLGEESFKKHISNIHNINMSGSNMLIVADSELHRTNLERNCIRVIMEAFNVDNIRVVTQGQ